MGQGESAVCARFQVEVVTSPERENFFGRSLPAEEWTWLHRKVTGSVNNSERIYRKDRDYVAEHDSWWKDRTSGEIHKDVTSDCRVDDLYMFK